MPYTAHESKSWVDRERKLLNAEYMYPFLFPPNHYPCYGCLGVLKACWFRRKSITDERDIGGSDAHWCHCINCTSNHAAGWECEMYVNISTFILYCVNIRGVSGSHTLIPIHEYCSLCFIIIIFFFSEKIAKLHVLCQHSHIKLSKIQILINQLPSYIKSDTSESGRHKST